MVAVLIVSGAPREWRLLLFFPSAGGAVGYLQTWLRFCAAFGLLGVFNFGRLGETRRVADDAALARDRRKALAIGAASAVVGLAIALTAMLI